MEINKAIEYFEKEVEFCRKAPAGNPVETTTDWIMALEANKAALEALLNCDLARRNKEEGSETCKAALDIFGVEAQIIKLHEEIGEFMEAFAKCLNDRDTVSHVAEEIADVSIMLAQMAVLLDCEKEVEWQRMCKMARLEKRIEDAKKLAETD